MRKDDHDGVDLPVTVYLIAVLAMLYTAITLGRLVFEKSGCRSAFVEAAEQGDSP